MSYLTTRLERAAFGTEQHILKVEFDVVLNARHGCFTLYPRVCNCRSVFVKAVSLLCLCPLYLLFVELDRKSVSHSCWKEQEVEMYHVSETSFFKMFKILHTGTYTICFMSFPEVWFTEQWNNITGE